MKKIAVGIIGFGTVGKGVEAVLRQNSDEIARRCGYQLQVVKVARRSWKGVDTASLPFVATENVAEILNDANIDVVLELMGGKEQAYDYIKSALENGKHVVTANKALIATRGEELFALARKNNLKLAFEAAVAGGIPIIKVLREGMSANKVQEIVGIINGTSNYILSAMTDYHVDFNDVLKDAQQLGYAEADPTIDIDGTDAAHKITILAAIAFGIPLQFEKVYIEGITNLCAQDIANADELGYKIKHLGLAIRRKQGVEIRVHPTLIPKQELLSEVNGVMNALQITGDAVGSTLHYGAGAGKLPTASAVVADLIDVVRELNLAAEDRLAEFGFKQLLAREDLPILQADEFISRYYLNVAVFDKIGVLAKVAAIVAEEQISIESIVQKNALKHNDVVPLIILTDRVAEAQINRAMEKLCTLPEVVGEIRRIRVKQVENDFSLTNLVK